MRALLAIGIAAGMMIPHLQTAEACGIKATVKAAKIKRNRPSSNPSTILILGERDSSLARELRNSGHVVEQASRPDAAQGTGYALVLADQGLMDDARRQFPNSQIVAKRGSRRNNTKNVELALRREGRSGEGRLRDAAGNRPIRAAGPEDARRNPGTGKVGGEVAVGGDVSTDKPKTERPKIALKSKTEQPAADKPVVDKPVVDKPKTDKPKTDKPKTDKPKTETRVAVNTKTEPAIKKDETEPADEPDADSEPAEPAKPVKAAKWTGELSFGLNRSSLNQHAKNRLRANATWMEQNTDASITIEGHTDTTGSAEYNMYLSEQRAQAAKDFLISLGVDGSRIEIAPRGEEEPAYEPGTSGKNRRIVLKHN